MMNLVGMGIFARVAEAKGFSAAARRLGISKSVVSKEVAKLEKSLGARLLNRTTRQLSLTEVGAAFYEHCARIVQEAEEAALLVDRLHSTPRGVLKCTAPVAFATLHIASALPDFLARCPELQVDMIVGDRFFDLADEGFDVAIRIARDLPPNMVARKLAPINRVVCATPEYFQKHGVPLVPQDLTQHNCLVYTHANPDSFWRFRSPEGEIAVPVRGNLRLNDDEVIWRAMLGGLGVSLLPTFTVGEDLQAGRLRAVLTEYTPAERNLYALYLPNRHLSAKVRVFIDFLLERFEPPPYWDLGWNASSADAAGGSGPRGIVREHEPGRGSNGRSGGGRAKRGGAGRAAG
jgi:DNA-binding transcriptional LysR family regulator